MRQRSTLGFGGLIGAVGIGSLLGVAAAGLVAVVTGEVFQPGSPWPTGLPGFCVLGACAGPLIARATRRWLLPSDPRRHHGARRRALLFTFAGMVVVPMAAAVGQLDADSVGVFSAPLMLLGSAVTVTLRWQASSSTDAGRHGRWAAGHADSRRRHTVSVAPYGTWNGSDQTGRRGKRR